ncbi:MAG: hypothetical protein LBT00_16245 [Spirochaetaceae bacterium]|jgi:hypothetical protein|nr:hypothetical protein [Spirochaetaceae bacterium]
MNIAVFTERAFLFVTLCQALWLTACIEEEEGQSIKTISVQNIPSSLEFTQEAKAQIDSSNEGKGNPYVHFSQEGDNWYIKTDGLYMLAAFLPLDAAANRVEAILKGEVPSQDLVDYGAAFALMKISGGRVSGRLLTLSTKANEIGYYWDGGNRVEGYNIGLLLLTPDARFILRADVSTKPYPGTAAEYTLNYGSVYEVLDLESINEILAFIKGSLSTDKHLSTVFRVKKAAVGEETPADSNKAEGLLTDDFVNDLFSRFS